MSEVITQRGTEGVVVTACNQVSCLRSPLSYHPVIGEEESCPDNDKKQSAYHEADLCIEEPADDQRGKDKQAVIEQSQAVLVGAVADCEDGHGKHDQVCQYLGGFR